MSQQKDSKLKKTTFQAVQELMNVIKSINKLIPHVVVVSLLLGYVVIIMSLTYASLKIAVLLVIILFTSTMAYLRSKNYGEATVALAAGLLALLTVEWNDGNFVVFFIAWLAFTLATLIIASIRLAASSEAIIVEAATALSPNQGKHQELMKKLEAIVSETDNSLGPIEKKEVIRTFAYRKLSLESMRHGLKAVMLLSVISGLNHNELARFIADIYQLFTLIDGEINERKYTQTLDNIYGIIRISPVSPAEYITAFNNSRYIVLSGQIKPEEFFDVIRISLEHGAKPDALDEYIKDNSDIILSAKVNKLSTSRG